MSSVLTDLSSEVWACKMLCRFQNATRSFLQAKLIEQVQLAVTQCHDWRGSLLEIVEALTRVPGTLERHFTTRSVMVMRLEYVSLNFSGAALMLSGRALERDVSYQVSCDLLIDVSIETEAVFLVESFTGLAERHSAFKLLSRAQPQV